MTRPLPAPLNGVFFWCVMLLSFVVGFVAAVRMR